MTFSESCEFFSLYAGSLYVVLIYNFIIKKLIKIQLLIYDTLAANPTLEKNPLDFHIV